MEWLKQILSQIREYWEKWSLSQKIILFSVAGVVILGFVLLMIFSAQPSAIPLLTRPITDETDLDRIAQRLDEENVSYQVTGDNRIVFRDERTARRMRALLAREDLIPQEVDPWELFDIQRWTQTDFERNVNLRRSIMRQLEQHLVALDDLDAASVTLVMPEDRLFQEDQNPVTASVIISPKPGSDIRENRRKIEGIEKLIIFAVEGLAKDSLSIADQSGVILNDFQSLEDFDRLELTKRELSLKQAEADKLQGAIFQALSAIYGSERVQLVNINVDIDMSKKTTETEEHFPIVTIPDNPLTPFSEREFVLTVPRSTESITEQYEGTGFNPEGPPGMEGQTPPAYKDLEGIVGRWSNDEKRINNEVNTRTTLEEKSPEIRRITASVALDGIWKWKYDEEGEVEVGVDGSIVRTYTPVGDDELATATKLVQDAIGFDTNRGDSVSVEHLIFDRTAQFAEEDAEFRRQLQRQLVFAYTLLGVIVVLITFILVRVITRVIERRRQRREEELARQYQAMREASLQGLESADTGPTLEEEIIAMVRERPTDTAQLLRTWILEE